MDIEPITKWVVWNPPTETKKGFWGHNHIEHGHVDGDSPVVKFPSQKWWKQHKWLKVHTYLVDGKVI